MTEQKYLLTLELTVYGCHDSHRETIRIPLTCKLLSEGEIDLDIKEEVNKTRDEYGCEEELSIDWIDVIPVDE